MLQRQVSEEVAFCGKSCCHLLRGSVKQCHPFAVLDAGDHAAAQHRLFRCVRNESRLRCYSERVFRFPCCGLIRRDAPAHVALCDEHHMVSEHCVHNVDLAICQHLAPADPALSTGREQLNPVCKLHSDISCSSRHLVVVCARLLCGRRNPCVK